MAGIAKLSDRGGARPAITAFGVPRPLVGPVATVLPFAELAVAIALLVTATAAAGAVAALVLLALFTSGITRSLARGRQPDCRCFGQLRSAPIGARTLARNTALTALALIVVAVGPGTSVGSWSASVTGMQWVALIVAMALAIAFVLEGSALITRWRPHRPGPAPTAVPPSGVGLPVGSPAPDFSLPGGNGERLTLTTVRASGRPVLLIFTEPGCHPCASIAPDVRRWQLDHRAEMSVVTVVRQEDHPVVEAYRFTGPPSAVLIGADGLIASPVVVGPEPIRALVKSALTSA